MVGKIRYIQQLALALTLVILVGGCGSHQQLSVRPGAEVVLQPATFSFDRQDFDLDLLPQYRISPGDTLTLLFTPGYAGAGKQQARKDGKPGFVLTPGQQLAVKFVHAPDLDENQIIRPDGTVSLPYIGQYRVAGKRVATVEQELKSRYRRELRNPELYVVVGGQENLLKTLNGKQRRITVRPDGFASFPLLGEMRVADLTVAALNSRLNTLLAIQAPGVGANLGPQKSASQEIFVGGEVKKPGGYAISRPLSLLQAITIAGGYQQGASRDSILVMRRQGDHLVATRVGENGIMGPDHGRTMFFLRPGDTVLVPPTSLKYGAEIAEYIKSFLMFRGWEINRLTF